MAVINSWMGDQNEHLRVSFPGEGKIKNSTLVPAICGFVQNDRDQCWRDKKRKVNPFLCLTGCKKLLSPVSFHPSLPPVLALLSVPSICLVRQRGQKIQSDGFVVACGALPICGAEREAFLSVCERTKMELAVCSFISILLNKLTTPSTQNQLSKQKETYVASEHVPAAFNLAHPTFTACFSPLRSLLLYRSVFPTCFALSCFILFPSTKRIHTILTHASFQPPFTTVRRLALLHSNFSCCIPERSKACRQTLVKEANITFHFML